MQRVDGRWEERSGSVIGVHLLGFICYMVCDVMWYCTVAT